MQVFNQILSFLNNVPAEVWETLGSAILVSPFASGIKKWASINSEKIMMFVVMLASIGSAALWYITATYPQSKWVILVQGMLVFATTQPVYFLGVKPFIKRFKVWWHAQIIKTAEYDAQVKSAAIPVVPPVVSTEVLNKTVDVEDFNH